MGYTFKKISLWSCLSLAAMSAYALEPGAAPQVPAGNTMGIPLSAPLPPGLYITNSTKIAQGQLKDHDGNRQGMDVDTIANTSILIYTPGNKILGGDYRAWVALPVVKVDQEVHSPRFGPLGSSHSTGLANIEIEPLDISWQLEPGVYASAGIGALAPTGKWEENQVSTAGNFWSVRPRAGISYLKNGWNASLEAQYYYHFENKDNQYKSGNELYVDATVLHKVGDSGLQVGPIAYWRQQVTKDRNQGHSYYGTTNDKAKQVGVGVQVLKDFGRGRFVGLSFSKDVITENAVSNKGRVTLNVSMPLYVASKPK